MDQREPALFPEWLKGAPGSSSSHSDEHSNGILPRSRFSLNAADRDASLWQSSSSFRRTVSSNGGERGENYSHSQAYSNFGRSRRDRDRDRDREKARDRGKDYLLENGYHDYSNPTRSMRTERDPLRRSQSMLSGGRTSSLPKRPGSNLINGVGSSRGGVNMGSFEREFPSLGAEEKLGVSNVGKVATPGIATAIQSLPLGLSAINGSEGWTSALAEAPGRVGSNGPQNSSGLQISASVASVASSAMPGLSMAAALVQPPSRVRITPSSSIDSERKKELKQLGKLIPMVHNNSEKSKSKGAKSIDYSAPKIGLQSSSPTVNHAIRLPITKLDMPKASHATNTYQVLNREKNGVETTAKDDLAIAIGGREATSLGGGVQSATGHHPRSPVISKLKVNGKSGGERKPLSQAQDRNDFFNAIRKQDMSKNSSVANPEPSCSVPSSSPATDLLVKSEQIAGASGTSIQEDDIPAPSVSSLERSVVVENGNSDACDVKISIPSGEDEPPPNEEEAAFMRSLGWEENGEEGALTPEEIEAFVKEHPKVGMSTKLKAVLDPELSPEAKA